MHADDMELVRDFAVNGSEAAFATLVGRYVHLVYSAALRRLGNAHEAEEVAQAVFIILARKAGGLCRETILSGWLYQTAQLTAANFHRDAMRRQRREQEAFMQFSESSGPDISGHRLGPLLEEAMARLGQKERDAVVLRFFENHTVQEVAAALGLREDAAQKRVNRATNKLRDFFVRRGVQVSTTTLLASIGTQAVQAAPAGLAAKITAAAVLKGAAGSSSTLTLVKGALKIMAWTKAKTIIVVGAGLLLAAGTTTVTVKEIHAHRAYPWQVRGTNVRRMINQMPPQVKIVPTIFPPDDRYTAINDRFLGTGLPLQILVATAYDASKYRMVFNARLPEGNYDFIANLPDGNPEALQREIKRQFHLVGKTETRETDVLLLTVKTGRAPGLRASAAPASRASNVNNGAGRYKGNNTPLSNFASFLEYYFEIPVIDHTGLGGRFDIDLRWDEQQWRQNPDALRQVLLDQLGLKLVPAREPVEMLVVEKMD